MNALTASLPALIYFSTEPIESLKNSDDSNWEDLYMDTKDKLADAMAEFDD